MSGRPLALFDIDRTMYDGLSLFPLIDAQIEEGIIDRFTAEEVNHALAEHHDGSLEYEDLVKKLMDIYAIRLVDRPVGLVEGSTNRFFEETGDFFNYVAPTIDLLTSSHDVVLVTGSSQFTARAVSKVFGVANSISTELETSGNRLSGKVKSYLATRHEKRIAIKHLVDTHPLSGSFGFGDSEGDVEMLRAVDNAVCINPTPGLDEIASNHEWTVVSRQEDLSAHDALLVVKNALIRLPS